VPGGVRAVPCSADHGGAFKRYCVEAGPLVQRVPADFMAPQREIMAAAPESTLNLFGHPVCQQPPSHSPPSGRQQTLCDRTSSPARHAVLADRLKMPVASEVASSVAAELKVRQGHSQWSYDLCAAKPDSYGDCHEDRCHAGLSETGRADSGSTYTCTVQTDSLVPRTDFSVRLLTPPIKCKSMVVNREHAQGSVHRRRPSLSKDAMSGGRGGGLGAQSLAALRLCHHHRDASHSTHLDGSSRAQGTRVHAHDVRPLSGGSASSAAQGSEMLFDPSGPACLPSSTAGTLGVIETFTVPATVAPVAVGNTLWHHCGRGRAGELWIEVRLVSMPHVF
jgi:uncharacterized low-complexity protein